MTAAQKLIATIALIVCGFENTVLAQDIECVCPQVDLWEENGSTAYWAFLYSRPTSDMDCTDDSVQSIIHFDAPGYTPLPATYCVATDPCAQCITIGEGAHEPGTTFDLKEWNSPHGLSNQFDTIRVMYVRFSTAAGSPVRYAKLFLLNNRANRMMLGYGFEIKAPDPDQVDPISILTVSPARCPQLEVRYASGDKKQKVAKRLSPVLRKFDLSGATFFVRVAP